MSLQWIGLIAWGLASWAKRTARLMCSDSGVNGVGQMCSEWLKSVNNLNVFPMPDSRKQKSLE
jgi:hypothetical protein